VILRRKRLPEDLMEPLERFHDVLAEVEPAKAALTDVMPTTRMPGRSLPDALLEFETHLERAETLMPGWRRPQTQDAWAACESGVRDALSRSRRFREEAPDLGGFEGLIWAVEHLMDPLEAFGAADERFRALRTVR
jgi:hypothetical protein